MWLSNRNRDIVTAKLAQMGPVTIGGTTAGVLLDGERRNVDIIAPTGYHCCPKTGQIALVLPCGEEESACLLGSPVDASMDLEAGEVKISITPASGIHFCNDGSIRLWGLIYGNGTLLSAPEEQGEVT